MLNTQDKYKYYQEIKSIFEGGGVYVAPYEEISYGLQFSIALGNAKGIVRIYQSKKNGTRHDFSQIKNEELLKLAESLISSGGRTEQGEKEVLQVGYSEDKDLPLIGTDESGKGDYFGPLVVAGVYADPTTKKLLKEMGAADSKTLSDIRVEKLAEEIMRICKYSIVVINNGRYNELYTEIKNLNRLLAWGHARVIENLLSDVECSYALSDQFGNPELIKNALMEKGKKLILEQRPRAEENVVVAAASILARNSYIKAMKELSVKYGMDFPKGASAAVAQTAQEFVKVHGSDKLAGVAKLHFIITEKINKA